MTEEHPSDEIVSGSYQIMPGSEYKNQVVFDFSNLPQTLILEGIGSGIADLIDKDKGNVQLYSNRSMTLDGLRNRV